MKMYRVNEWLGHNTIPVWYMDEEDAKRMADIHDSTIVEEDVDIYDFCELCGVAIDGYPEGWHDIDDAMAIVKELFTEYGSSARIRSGETLADRKGWI